MRALNSLLLASALLIGLLALPIASFAESQNFQVAVEGMTCADCAKALTMALEKVPNIDKSSVKVSLAKNQATLKMNDASKETQALVKKAIEDAGYTVKSIQTVPETASAKSTAKG